MKKYPIGIQTFEKIIEGNFLYIDKTKEIHTLINSGNYYFISRPRRFGKSLLLSTIKSIFEGKKELFKDLWIYDKLDWQNIEIPVINITFNNIGYHGLGLENAILRELQNIATNHGITLSQTNDVGLSFKELIISLGKDKKVVILIDEYDKPIIDFLTEIDQAKAHQKILKSFYSIIKAADPYIRFLLITGVSKFSKVSIFSDLNNLYDITLLKKFNNIAGYTHDEVLHYFDQPITKIAQEEEITKEALITKIKQWYNGYSWDGKQFLYNPFSMLCFFDSQSFHNFWFATGTPTFLINLLKERFYYKLEKVEVGATIFESYNIENLETRSLLFQTGYLTIKEIDEYGLYHLGYPNNEVRNAMFSHLISAFRHTESPTSAPLVVKLTKAFKKNDIPQLISIINTLFKDIPNQIFIANKEAYYHSVIHLVFNYLGHYINSEVNTSDGRIDAVVQSDTHIYVFEFKLDQSAQAAMQQIRDKNYTSKYKHSNKEITALAINFSSQTKAIHDWLSETI